MVDNKQDDEYQKWLDEHYDDLVCECAESGADRELDFDFEKFCEDRYLTRLCDDPYFHILER